MRALILLLTLAGATVATAAENIVLTHQGQLLGADDRPVEGTVEIKVRLWNHATSLAESSVVWEQTFPDVRVVRGAYALQLGRGTDLPASHFERELFLGITVKPGPELRPRLPLGAVATAVSARVAKDLDCTGCVTAAKTSGLVALSPSAAQQGDVSVTGTVTAAQFAGDGSELTALNPAALAGPIKGSQLESVPAEKLLGKIGDAQLGSAFVHLAGDESITGVKTFKETAAFGADVPFTVSTKAQKVANLDADRLDGLDASEFALAKDFLPRAGGQITGSLGIGVAAPGGTLKLDVAGGVRADAVEIDYASCPAPAIDSRQVPALPLPAPYCLLGVPTKMTWMEAKGHCERWGGQLAWPEDSNWNNLITAVRNARIAEGEATWIGVHAANFVNSSNWITTNAMPSQYGNWGVGEPSCCNEACVQLTGGKNVQGALWNNLQCKEQLAFVCQRRIR